MAGSQIISEEKKGVDPEDIRLPRPSHNELLKKLKWIKGPACIQIDDEQHCFDPFWLSSLSMLSEADFKELDALRSFIEVDIEDKMTSHIPSILHVGGFPFPYTLIYSTSTIGELKSKHLLRVDFPLFGGYISYKSELLKHQLESEYNDNREFFEKLLHDGGFKWQVFWGLLEHEIQNPNIIYFEKDNKFLYADDILPGERGAHSIFFDYIDIFTCPPNKRDSDKIIEFRGDQPKDKPRVVKVKLGDIKILFDDITDEGIVVDSFEISALDFKLNIRPIVEVIFHNRCKEVT
jgi:hypothetical protein